MHNEDSNQPAQPAQSLQFPHEETSHPWLSKMPSEDLDQTVNLQADLNHLWAHMAKGTFADVATHLTFTTFLANSADNILVIFFLFFPENRF